MVVTLLYVEGCPHWRAAEERLREAVAVTGRRDIEVHAEPIANLEEAERRAFRGSPGVLVDGRDPFADPDTPVGLTCRWYRTTAGRDTAPSVDDLVVVLSGA